MKRSEAFWILNEMYELANEAQKQALNIAQRDIEFVDLMQDVPVQRWIPVTERLPECDQVVLCYKADRGVRIGKHLSATYADGVSAFKDCCRDYAFGATHWMPLSEPPKEE